MSSRAKSVSRGKLAIGGMASWKAGAASKVMGKVQSGHVLTAFEIATLKRALPARGVDNPARPVADRPTEMQAWPRAVASGPTCPLRLAVFVRSPPRSAQYDTHRPHARHAPNTRAVRTQELEGYKRRVCLERQMNLPDVESGMLLPFVCERERQARGRVKLYLCASPALPSPHRRPRGRRSVCWRWGQSRWCGTGVKNRGTRRMSRCTRSSRTRTG